MRLVSIALLAATLACVGVSIDEVQTRILGLSSHRVASCMGPPDHLDVAEEGQVWLFVRTLSAPSQDVEIEADIEGAPTHGRRGPNVIYGDVLRKDAVEPRGTSPGLAELARRGLCLLRFEFREQRVTELQALGRTRAGLNADTECARLALACIDDLAEDAL